MISATGYAAVYDPAIYYGHREMDIGMTNLFGGFDQRFYDGIPGSLSHGTELDSKVTAYTALSITGACRFVWWSLCDQRKGNNKTIWRLVNTERGISSIWLRNFSQQE